MIVKTLNMRSDNYLGFLPNKDYIFTQSGKAYENLRTLLIDPHLSSVVQQRKSGVLSLNHQFLPVQGYENLLEEVIIFVTSMNLQSLISSILEAPLYGFQPIEILYKFDSGKWIPESFLCLKQEDFKIFPDMSLGYCKKDSFDLTKVPEFKILNPSYGASKIFPYGQAIFSKCYWIVTFKTACLRSWKEFSDKFGLPFLLGSYSQGMEKTEVQDLVDKIAEMSSDNVLIHPKDIELQVQEMKSNASKEMFNGLINVCNTEISKAVLSQTLTTELNIGSYAAASIHYKVRREITEQDIRLVEETINELINFYTLINYNAKNVIKFDIIFSNQDNKDLFERDEKLSKIPGFKFTDSYFKKHYSLSDDDFTLK